MRPIPTLASNTFIGLFAHFHPNCQQKCQQTGLPCSKSKELPSYHWRTAYRICEAGVNLANVWSLRLKWFFGFTGDATSITASTWFADLNN